MHCCYREVSEEYGHEVVKLCELLMRVLSASLGLDEAYFQRAFGGDQCGATLRANYYPRCPQPDLTLGLSPHSDPGVLTVLFADEHVRGLQVRSSAGEWATVQPVRDAFIVNVGDQIQVTNQFYLLHTRTRLHNVRTINACLVVRLLELAIFYFEMREI
jgi:isopenicillin N synthase-like dioxygenase